MPEHLGVKSENVFIIVIVIHIHIENLNYLIVVNRVNANDIMEKLVIFVPAVDK